MELRTCGVSADEYSCAHGAQINFGDLTPYLTYGPSASYLAAGVSRAVGTGQAHPLSTAAAIGPAAATKSCQDQLMQNS